MPQPQTKAQVSKDTIHPVLPNHPTVGCRETYRSLAGNITAFKEVTYNHFKELYHPIIYQSLLQGRSKHQTTRRHWSDDTKIEMRNDTNGNPDDEGYDPDGKDGAILIDLCDEDQDK